MNDLWTRDRHFNEEETQSAPVPKSIITSLSHFCANEDGPGNDASKSHCCIAFALTHLDF